jgi:hypothetical protein
METLSPPPEYALSNAGIDVAGISSFSGRIEPEMRNKQKILL